MILGDSLQVMASLSEREALRGKVQMIYIDPPYGIKFGSNWQVSARKTRVSDGKLEDASREVEMIKEKKEEGAEAAPAKGAEKAGAKGSSSRSTRRTRSRSNLSLRF